MEEIMLSIYIATYNHERYIARALDSVIMQKANFRFEVLVGEDASTDGTRAILKEYEKKYPGKFTMFYREHNMYREEVRNGEDLKRRCKGKYIIALEGDDFWTDENKIQKQVDFLEAHPEYLAVAHKCVVVGDDSKPNGEVYPDCQDVEYTVRHLACHIMPGQLTTIMYRNFYRDETIDLSLCKSALVPGDRCIYFSICTNGKICCMQEEMSAYRHIITFGSSYSATVGYDFWGYEKMYTAFIQYAKNCNNKETQKYAEYMYMHNLLYGYKEGYITFDKVKENYKKCEKPCRAFFMYISAIFNKNVLKHTVYV